MRTISSTPGAAIALLVLTLTASTAGAGDLMLLGKRQFVCKKGELRLHGTSGSKLYPAGKREKVRMFAPIGMLAYTCRYVRSIIQCPIGTEVVTVKRGIYSGRYEAECLGDPKGLPTLPDSATAEDRRTRAGAGDEGGVDVDGAKTGGATATTGSP